MVSPGDGEALMQALWMVLASLLFASMGVCIKFAASHFTSSELVLYRGLIGMVVMAVVARIHGVSLKTPVPGMHLWRAAIGVASLGSWFYAIIHLPLATAMTLNYMSSVWVAAFLVGGALLNWKPGSPGDPPGDQGALVFTVLAGFAGVVLMLQPTIEQNQIFAGLVGLCSGMGAAFAYMQVIALARVGEPDTRTVFYFAVGSAVAGLAGMLLTGVSPWDWGASLWLIPIGLLASGGQLCMTRAYRLATSRGSTLVVANLQYSGIVFSVAYGLLLFGDHMTKAAWLGMALIIGSGICATILRERAAPDAPAEEH
jgi:drug/metabolite transporter (DMT)-like permease